MKTVKANRRLSSSLILAGLWLINITIVIFGSPILILNKIKSGFARKNAESQPRERQNSTSYLPHGTHSKL